MTSRFILAISTSSGVAKVAVAAEPPAPGSPAVDVFHFEITDYKSQSALLLPSIQQHLEQNDLKPSACAAIAVDIGPGGFTSLRTACGVAQGLAVAWNRPTVPMTSFECMLPAQLEGQAITVLMDARLNEIYAACLQRTSQGTQWVRSPYLLPMAELQHIQDSAVCDPTLFGSIPGQASGVQPGTVSATRLAQLAWEEFGAGRLAKPFDCQPLYVRDKVAQTTSERLALKHGAV